MTSVAAREARSRILDIKRQIIGLKAASIKEDHAYYDEVLSSLDKLYGLYGVVATGEYAFKIEQGRKIGFTNKELADKFGISEADVRRIG